MRATYSGWTRTAALGSELPHSSTCRRASAASRGGFYRRCGVSQENRGPPECRGRREALDEGWLTTSQTTRTTRRSTGLSSSSPATGSGSGRSEREPVLAGPCAAASCRRCVFTESPVSAPRGKPHGSRQCLCACHAVAPAGPARKCVEQVAAARGSRGQVGPPRSSSSRMSRSVLLGQRSNSWARTSGPMVEVASTPSRWAAASGRSVPSAMRMSLPLGSRTAAREGQQIRRTNAGSARGRLRPWPPATRSGRARRRAWLPHSRRQSGCGSSSPMRARGGVKPRRSSRTPTR